MMTTTILETNATPNNIMEATPTKDEVLEQLQTMTEKQLQFLLRLSQTLFFDTNVN